MTCPHCQSEAPDHICTLNRFGVASGPGRHAVSILFQVPPTMAKQDALLLAAYLVSIADWSDGHREFLRVLEAVENA